MRVSSSLGLIGGLQYGISGPLDCNVYALRGPGGLAIIDSGGGTHTELLIRNLREDLGQAKIDALILTHSHPDHSGGAACWRAMTGCRIFAPEQSRNALETADEEAVGLRAAREAGIYPADFHLAASKVDAALEDGRQFEAAGLRFLQIGRASCRERV